MKRNKVQIRVLAVARYILENESTIRDAAKHFGISKSTVHLDITGRLPEINPDLFHEVSKVIAYNKAMRHHRGGEATTLLWKNKRVL